MPSPNYDLDAGTPIGESRNEIFNKYGSGSYESAQYGWHHEHVSETETKMYNLVQSDTVKFLIATIKYRMVDARETDPITKKLMYPDMPKILVVDRFNPISIHLEWRDANIPFINKDECDRQSIPYVL
jgi:hypothetical protein